MGAESKSRGKHGGGRPDDFSMETAVEFCRRFSGGIPMKDVCQQEDMPDKSTIFRWIGTRPEFSDMYARAREACLEHEAEALLAIADEASNDWMQRNDPENPGWLANHEHINRSRLRIDTRKWILSKLLPRKYGDRIEVEQKTSVEHTVSLDNLAPEDVSALVSILGKAQADPKVDAKKLN